MNEWPRKAKIFLGKSSEVFDRKIHLETKFSFLKFLDKEVTFKLLSDGYKQEPKFIGNYLWKLQTALKL